MLLIPILISTLLLNSCWDYAEYEQLTQIYSLGIDLNSKQNEITTTLQYIPITKSSGEKSKELNKGTVYSASAITIMDALTKLQQASPNKLFFGYIQVIVIGEDAARHIMKDLIVYFDRTPSIRNSVSIIIVPGKAEGVIATIDPNSVTSSGKKIRMLLTSAPSNGTTHSVTLHDFSQMMVRTGVEAVAPRIITTPSMDDVGESAGGSQNDVRFAIEKHGNILASGMAVFKKEKLIDWLDNRETLGLNWILGNKISSYKTSNIDDPSLSNNSTKELSLYADIKKMLYFYISKAGSKVKVKIENEKPVIYLNIKIEASVRKYYSDQRNEYIDPSIISLIEEKLERSINSDISAALKKSKDELNTDIFGFGFEFYRQHPKLWHAYFENSWDDMFKDVDVNVNVEAKINNTGTNIKRFIIK